AGAAQIAQPIERERAAGGRELHRPWPAGERGRELAQLELAQEIAVLDGLTDRVERAPERVAARGERDLEQAGRARIDTLDVRPQRSAERDGVAGENPRRRVPAIGVVAPAPASEEDGAPAAARELCAQAQLDGGAADPAGER